LRIRAIQIDSDNKFELKFSCSNALGHAAICPEFNNITYTVPIEDRDEFENDNFVYLEEVVD
jgi:hypothetical protein